MDVICEGSRGIRALRRPTPACAVSRMAGCVVGKDCRQVFPASSAPDASGNTARTRGLFLECCSQLGGRRMAPRTASPFRTVGAMVGVLGEHAFRPEDARVVSAPLGRAPFQYSVLKMTPGGASGEPDDRQGAGARGSPSLQSAGSNRPGTPFPNEPSTFSLQSNQLNCRGGFPRRSGRQFRPGHSSQWRTRPSFTPWERM